MPIKWIGAVLVFISAFSIGFMKSRELSGREKSLKNLRTALNILESEIVFSSHYLKEALKRISDLCGCGGLFSDISDQMQKFSVMEAWNISLKKSQKKLFLKDSDIEILNILASQIGMSDREQQVKHITHVKLLLEKAEEDARHEYQTLAKLYRSMGIFAGLFIIILLI